MSGSPDAPPAAPGPAGRCAPGCWWPSSSRWSVVLAPGRGRLGHRAARPAGRPGRHPAATRRASARDSESPDGDGTTSRRSAAGRRRGRRRARRPGFLGARGQGEGTLGARRGRRRRAPAAGVLGCRRARPPPLTSAQQDVLAGLPTDGSPVTDDLGGDLGDYRLVASTAPDGDVLVTGLPLSGTADAVRRAGRRGAGRRPARPGRRGAGRGPGHPAHAAPAGPGRRHRRPGSPSCRWPAARCGWPSACPPEDTDPRTEVGQVGTALNRMLDHVERLAGRAAGVARRRCASSSPTPATSCAPRWPRSAATPSWSAASAREVPADVGARACGRVESEALRMTALVEDLLLLARLDAGRALATRTVDLTALVVDAVSDAHAAGPDHGWQLDLPDDPGRWCPATRPGCTRCWPTCWPTRAAHTPDGHDGHHPAARRGRLRRSLQVVDDGPGHPGRAAPARLRAVRPRRRLPLPRTAGSTGLGLAIVHAVVDRARRHGRGGQRAGPDRVHRPAAARLRGLTRRPSALGSGASGGGVVRGHLLVDLGVHPAHGGQLLPAPAWSTRAGAGRVSAATTAEVSEAVSSPVTGSLPYRTTSDHCSCWCPPAGTTARVPASRHSSIHAEWVRERSGTTEHVQLLQVAHPARPGPSGRLRTSSSSPASASSSSSGQPGGQVDVRVDVDPQPSAAGDGAGQRAAHQLPRLGHLRSQRAQVQPDQPGLPPDPGSGGGQRRVRHDDRGPAEPVGDLVGGARGSA